MRRGGGRIQLVYVGKEDNFLTGNPKVSFFRFVYRQHTNFAIESIRMFFNGNPDFGQRFNVFFPRFGDLIGPMFLIIDLPPLFLQNGQPIGYTNSIGNAIIEDMRIMIGETEIDRHDGMWEFIWNNITLSSDKKKIYESMVGQFDGNPVFTITGPYRLHIPLTFWFNKDPGQYLPLIALQYHQVQIQFKFRNVTDLYYTINSDLNNKCKLALKNNLSIPNVELWGDFVFLDTEERRRIVSKSMDYLIEQVQIIEPVSIDQSKANIGIQLTINNPVKEILWVFRRNVMENTNELFNFTSLGASEAGSYRDLMLNAVIQLDGQDRFQKRDGKYFRLISPYQHHTANPNFLYIYSYSFALRPEEIQPSGTLNASRFEDIRLQLETPTCPDPITLKLRGDMTFFGYAHGYNILRITQGYGGLLFAN
jgi:hypothetical protein